MFFVLNFVEVHASKCRLHSCGYSMCLHMPTALFVRDLLWAQANPADLLLLPCLHAKGPLKSVQSGKENQDGNRMCCAATIIYGQNLFFLVGAYLDIGLLPH